MAKLKADKSTRRLLLQIQKGLPSASDPDKGMIAAALNSLVKGEPYRFNQGAVLAGRDNITRELGHLDYRQLGQYDSDNLSCDYRDSPSSYGSTGSCRGTQIQKTSAQTTQPKDCLEDPICWFSCRKTGKPYG